RNVRSLLESARNPEAASATPGSLADASGSCLPAESIGSRFKNGPQPLIAEILQPELKRVDAGQIGQLIDVPLAGKIVRRGSECPVRSLSQGRVRLMKFLALGRDVIESPHRGLARIVVVKVPGSQLAVLRYPSANVDHAGRAEIGPGELFLTGPDDFHRLAGGFRQSRGFDRRI